MELSPPNQPRRSFTLGLLGSVGLPWQAAASSAPAIPLLTYHRFAPEAVDSMTLRLANFESHLALIRRLGCSVIPLADWLACCNGAIKNLPQRAVVLCADDGHRSQFLLMAPLLRAQGWPVTLFVYPSAISNASYAMSWQQLRELAADKAFSIQSHSYWHPNLLQDRARMKGDEFLRQAKLQFQQSRDLLQQQLGNPVDLLAWPFGLSDAALQAQAAQAGYSAAFGLGNRSASCGDPRFDLPRHLMVDSVNAKQLEARLEAAFATGGQR